MATTTLLVILMMMMLVMFSVLQFCEAAYTGNPNRSVRLITPSTSTSNTAICGGDSKAVVFKHNNPRNLQPSFTVMTMNRHSIVNYHNHPPKTMNALWKLQSSRSKIGSSTSSFDNDDVPIPPTEVQSTPTNNFNNDKESSLSTSYRIAQYGYTIASILLFLLSGRPPYYSVLATIWGSAMGMVMAAKLSSILHHAYIEQRLSSDTYKRLNIGLFGFNMIGLLAIPGEAALIPSRFVAQSFIVFLTVLRLWGCYVSWNGWILNIPKITNNNTTTLPRVAPWSELGRGMKETLLGLRVRSAKKALTYRNCLLIVCCGIVSHFMEGWFNVRYQQEFTRTWLDITLQWSAVSRLFMIATMIYSLKDAAERDRLTGTTFIELNLMIGAWALLVGLGQAIYPVGFAAYRGVEMYAFAIPFLLKAYKSHKEKSVAAKIIPSNNIT